MKILKILTVMMVLTAGQSAFAAIGCKVGMNNCPGTPGDVLKPIPVVTEVTVVGYAEVASPKCTEVDLVKAIHQAKTKAFNDALFYLGEDAVQAAPYKVLHECGQSIYAGSFKGNSWMVQVFGKFTR